MTENSYMSLFSDPSSDFFNTLTPSADDVFASSGLQPSIVSTVSSYQPLEAESIMTLGEPSQSKASSAGSNASSSMYAQLGSGLGALGGSHLYNMPHSGYPSHGQATHPSQRLPLNPSYFTPGSLTQAGFAQQNPMQPQRFSHEQFRHASPYQGYPGMAQHGNPPGLSACQPNNASSWPAAGASYLHQNHPQMRQYPGAPLGQVGYPGSAMTGSDPSQSQFLPQAQQSQMNTQQSMQGARVPMHAGYAPHMPQQMSQYPPQANGMQYPGYGPPQQRGAMPAPGTQQRLPGMPYGVPAGMQRFQSGVSSGPSSGPSSAQQMHPPSKHPQQQSMFMPMQRPSIPVDNNQRSPSGHPGHDVHTTQNSRHEGSESTAPRPTPPPHPPQSPSVPTEPRNSSAMSSSSTAPSSQSPVPRSPHQSAGQDSGGKSGADLEASLPKPTLPSPMSPHVQSAQRPQQQPFPGMNMMPNGVSSPQPSNPMMQNQNRMPTPSFSPGQGPMMHQGPQQMFQPMEGGPHPGQGFYSNGPQMMGQMGAARPPSVPPGQPASFPNIAAELHHLKQSLNTYMNSNQRSPAIDAKIIPIRQKIEYLERQQAAGPPHGQMRMPSGPVNGNLRPPAMVGPGMLPQMPMHPNPGPIGSHPMVSQPGPGALDVNQKLDNQRPGILPPSQNGFPTNGMPPAPDSAPPSQSSQSPTHEGGFSAELTSSQESEDESANKYASPKKKRNSRNRASSSRRRKAKADSGDSPAKSPSKSKSRPKSKAKTVEKSSFQFGKKNKKKKGSDDEGDDMDATPPPSPRAPPVVQDFDGDYVEKRRSTRAVKKKKYNDEDNDQSEVDMLLAPIGENHLTMELENAESLPADVPPSDSTVAESVEPARKYFVQPGDSEPIVVEKVMADRMGERPVKNDTSENGEEGEKQETIPVEEFYVKFKSYSYLHCDWKTVAELEVIDKRIKQKVQRYKQKKETQRDYMEEADEEPFDPNYTEVDRVLDEREFPDGEDLTKMRPYFLCKWAGLPYDECTWEVEEDCDVTKIAEYRMRQTPPPPAERKRVARPSARNWKKMDSGLVYKNGNTLRDYQLEGVNWLLFSYHHGQNCILADEMGLGKTVQSTVFLEHLRRFGIRGPFLVVVPLSTLGNWSREVETWTDMNSICYHGGSTTREIIRDYEFYFRNEKGQKIAGIHKFNIFITTYEILLADIYELREIEWRVVVIDEAHRLKNMKCKLLEGLKLLDLEHRVLLTGTPLQNNVEELFSLLHFLEPERFSNMEAFSLDFGNLKTDDQVTKLQQILKPMMLRRLKEDVEKSIAPKEETIIEVELTNMQKKWYRAILEKNFAFLQKGTNTANVPNLMNTMMELRKCCNHPYLLNGAEDSIIEDITAAQGSGGAQDRETLLKALVQASGKLVLIDKLLPKLKEGGHKVLIFSQMVRCLDILEDYLVQKRHIFERIDGRVRGPDRQAAIDRFSREDSDRFVFLLCTRAGGLGINLTAADTVIIFDSDWNPQNDLQAQARCHRIGQDKPVKIYRLITHNSYEREMFDRASLKLGLDKAVLQSGQMTGTRDSHSGSQPQLSKSDVEDLLKRGAYGALMEDDTAADQFCTEDIDQILQRRTQTVQLEAGEKGSTFSKATFAATGTRDDIDINDPDFWQKWAKKAEITTDKDAFENDLIIHEPRRRLQVKRYGEELEEEPDDASDEDYDSDDEDGKGRRGRKGKKGRGKDRDEDRPRPGSWLRTECLRLEKALLAWGWGRWKEILNDCNFKRHFSEKDVEIFGRTLVHHCCKQYSGSDDKAKPYIWNLVQYAYMDDWEQRKAQALKLKQVAGELDDQEAGSSSRSAKKNRRSVKKAGTPEDEPATNDAVPDWENDSRFDPEHFLDISFLKHMKKHSINRLVLRLKLLESLKEEVIQDLGEMIMADTPFDDVPLEVPPVDSLDKPMEWWDDDADKCLLIGVYKHGYERYNDVRDDPRLCFLPKCGPTGQQATSTAASESDMKDTAKDSDGDGDSQETEEPTEAESTDAGSDVAEGNKKKTRESKKDKEKAKEEAAKATPVKPGRGRRLNAAKRAPPPSEPGQVNFPTDPDLNTRVRRLIVAFEKRRIRAEQMEVKRQQRLEKQMQADREREAKRLEQQQKKWSKREEGEFLRAVSVFGVEHGESKEELLWDRFREVSRLDKKLDKTLTEYYKCFIAMIRKVCGKKLSRDEEGAASQVDSVPESKAQLCLQRIDLLNRVRTTALRHNKLEDRLRLCQPASNFPAWWIPGEHDKELLEGAAKHGLTDSACNIAVDPDYSFGDCIKNSIKAEESAVETGIKMKSILKLEKTKPERNGPGRPRKVDKEKAAKMAAEKMEVDEKQPDKKHSEDPSEEAVDNKDDEDKNMVSEEKEEKDALDESEAQEEEDKTNTEDAEGREEETMDEDSEKKERSEIESETEKSGEEKLLPDIPAGKEEKSAEEADEEPKRIPDENEQQQQPVSAEEPSNKVPQEEPVEEENEKKEEIAHSSEKTSSSPAPSPQGGSSPTELTVAQLLGKSVYAKSWPSDRAIQARLEHICYCVEQNRWPSKRQQEMLSAKILDESSASTSAMSGPVAVSTPSSTAPISAQLSESFMDNPDFAMLAAAGHIPGLNGLGETKRRRGRRPRAEIEAERMAQYHAAHQALLQQQQALISAAQAVHSQAQSQASRSANSPSSSRKAAHSGSERSSERSEKRGDISQPPPAHQKVASSQPDNEMEGVLDLTGKGKPSTSSSPSTSAMGKGKKEVTEKKGEKLSQKVDNLLKKRKQETETEMDPMDPNGRVPVINLRDGSILQGEKAPKRKDLAQWLMRHENYVVDTTAFNFPGMVFSEALTNGSMTSAKKSSRDRASTSSEQHQVHLSGDENVTVINRKNGKKISGRKAPQLKNLGSWLEANKDYEIDPSWADIIREDGAAKMIETQSSASSSKRRKGAANNEADAAALFGGNPFAAGFPGLLSGFSNPRMPFAFPGLPGFPMNFSGLMPGMSAEDMVPKSDKKGEGSSSKEKDRDKDKESTKERKKKDKEEKASQQASQQAMESMMQSQLPFIFPQAGLFGGLHPMFSQGFAGLPAGFPFGMPSSMMNGFGAASEEAASSSSKSRKGEREREKEGTPSQRSAVSPAASSEASMRLGERSRASTSSSSTRKNSASMQKEREREKKQRKMVEESETETSE